MDTQLNAAPARPADTPSRWGVREVEALFELPFNDLLHRAHTVHRRHFDPNAVQLSTLLSVKTGGCPEDCGYCPQAARYHTGVDSEEMMSVETVVAAARAAKRNGATRLPLSPAAPWRRRLRSTSISLRRRRCGSAPPAGSSRNLPDSRRS